MSHDSDTKILKIVKLRAIIANVSKDGRMGVLHTRFDEILEHMLDEALRELPETTLASLMQELDEFAPAELQVLYENIQTEKTLIEILHLRENAVRFGKALDIDHVISGFTSIPVKTFDWSQKTAALNSLMSKFKSFDCDYFELSDRCTEFFETIDDVSLPAGYPEISGGIVGDITKKGLLSNENTKPIIDCVNLLVNSLTSNGEKNTTYSSNSEIPAEHFSLPKNDAYMFLGEVCSSGVNKASAAFEKYIVHWVGPGKTTFLDKWWNSDPSEQKGFLIAACTGIHPQLETEKWDLWVAKEQLSERKGAEAFLSEVEANRFYYDLGFILSCRNTLDGNFDETWKPLVEKLHEITIQEGRADASTITTLNVSKAKDLKKNPNETHLVDFDEIADSDDLSLETNEMFLDSIEDDFNLDELYVHEKPKSRHDRIIEERSTWNRYFKPFLSENLIGVLGAGFLMLAWFTISIWVWDKGEYFRILAAALPMFFTSLGLGWISSFFYKNLDRGVSPKAPLLFASLCVLTLPFNFLISLSMLLSGSFAGIFAGVLMAVIYTAAMFLISKWTSDIFSFSSGTHLAEINGYIILPALFAFFMDGIPSIYVDSILFLTTFSFARMLYMQRDTTELSSRFKFYLFGGNCLLIIFIFSVYMRQMPSTASIALFVQLSAMVVSFFAKLERKIYSIIIASCLSLISLLVGVSISSTMLLACLVLAALMWAYQRRDIDASWPDEIVVSLILLLVPAGIYVLGGNWLLSGFFFLPVVFVAYLYERKMVVEKLKVISFSLPLYSLLLASYILFSGNVTPGGIAGALVFALVYGVYGYLRYERLYSKGLWLCNIFLMIFFPFLCVVLQMSIESSIAIFGTSVLFWSLASMKLNGPLSYQYRMSVQWIVVFIFTAMVMASFGLNASFSIPSIAAFILVVVCLLISAKRSTSQLPMYLLLACSGLSAFSLAQYLGISFKTGTGSAVSSAALIFFAAFLDRFSIWQNLTVKETFFNKKFPFKTDKFIIYPIENAAWILAILSFAKAMINYTFVYGSAGISFSGVKICFTLLVLLFVCIRFVKRYGAHVSRHLVLVPSIALYVNISSLVPPAWLPVFIVLSMFALLAFIKYLESSEKTNPVIFRGMNDFMMVLSYTIIPVGFLMYAYYYILSANLIENQFKIVLSAVLISVFVHMTSVRKINEKLVHIIVGHGTVLVSLAYLLVEKDLFLYLSHLYIEPTSFSLSLVASSLNLALWLSVVYFLPGFLLETCEKRIKKAYSEALHVWLLITAHLYTILIISYFSFGLREIPLYFFIMGIFLVHAGNRNFYFFPPVFLKAFFCLCTGLLVFKDPLVGIFAGLIIFSVIEYGILFFEKYPGLRMQSVVPQGRGETLWRVAWLVHILTILFLFMHMVLFIFAPFSLPSFLMYALIPFSVFVFRNLGYRYTGYMAVGLFVYANCFVSLRFSGFFQLHGLNDIHLLCIVMVSSLLLYRGFDITKQQIGRAAL